MPERFGGFEPPDEPTPPPPGIVNLGFNDLKEFPTGACVGAPKRKRKSKKLLLLCIRRPPSSPTSSPGVSDTTDIALPKTHPTRIASRLFRR
jgi:hypothetical protein